MNKLNILLTRSMLAGDVDYIRSGLDKTVPEQYEITVPSAFDEETLCALAPQADVFLGPYVTERMLSAAERLELIQVPWTGMDTFNFSAVNGYSVPVCNTHSNADAVAELGIALTLDLIKKVSYHDRKMRAGSWNRDQIPLSLKSPMVRNSRVCILGLGNIGYRMAQIFKAFGAIVTGVSDRRSPDGVLSEVFPQCEIQCAAKKADIVVSTLPLTDATKGIIDSDYISALKPGVMLVNMSRAGVIDENALYSALVSGQVGGFAADVWWNAPKRGESASYPSVSNSFWEMDNVVMSPHRAGFVEGSLPHLDGAVENIAALILGQPLSNKVDISKGF